MFWIIFSVTGLFLLSLGLKKFFPRLCAICFAVSVTWAAGLVLRSDPTILAILMGGSAVGLMYYLAGVLPRRFMVFKLPYLVTAFVLIFFVLRAEFDPPSLLALLGVWILFGLMFLFRDGRTRAWFKKVVECCKNW